MSGIQVRFLDGPRSSEPELAFEGVDQVIFGRDVHCHVLLPMPEVSHRHATLVHRNGQWFVVDSSRTGTWVNGRRVTGECAVDFGDRLTIGSQSMVLLPPRAGESSRGPDSIPGVVDSVPDMPAPTDTRVMRRRSQRAAPSELDPRANPANVPPGHLPDPLELEGLPIPVVTYWYVHAWRLYQQARKQSPRPEEDDPRRLRRDLERLRREVSLARSREEEFKQRVSELEADLAAEKERVAEMMAPPPSVSVAPPSDPGTGSTGSMSGEEIGAATAVVPSSMELQAPGREQLAQLRRDLRDFQDLVNRLSEQLGGGETHAEVAGILGEMSAMLLSMEYLIEGLLSPQGPGPVDLADPSASST